MSSLVGMIVYGLWIALLISLPILVVIVVVRIIRRTVTPHDREIQQLLERAVTLLEENNRLLSQQMAGKQPEENREQTPLPGQAR